MITGKEQAENAKHFVTSDNEVAIFFDLSEFSQAEKTDFIIKLLTDHHQTGVGISAELKQNEKEVFVYISWELGCEKFAEKVIKRIEAINTSK